MKKLLLFSGLSAVFSISAQAANYEDFIAPSSLGKNISALNKQYKLDLKERSKGRYSNGPSAICSLTVKTDKENRVSYIKIKHDKNCQYRTKSNVNYSSKTTKIKNILSQVNIENIQFIPECFSCSSRKGINDSLVVNRAEDKYYTEFEIEGRNKNYTEYIAQNLFGKFSSDNYDSVMEKLETRVDEDPNLYDRNEFKLQAIELYNLQNKPISYTIALK